ncbi:HI0074 family nucleotidyltransferase substrate-binding subunit [Effusibacillus consociatus]|uniref:HI0074 family nucleotidyltransferase substrate-binding subunit n=1 Tax=Effusibacillus consociatus TaxID=1117041 RepID=A0ABV9PXE5_9BACL
MNESKSVQSLLNLGKALERLREALQVPEDSLLAVDGTIQRFEFAIELYWKTLKRLLANEGIQTNTPRETLQRAFQAHWLSDETAWLQMLKDCNETSHVYAEETALRIYNHIKRYFPEMERTYKFLLDRFGENQS